MNYIEYTIKVYYDGTKEWYLNNEELTEEEFNNRMKLGSCEGKIVEIKYSK